MMKRHALSLDVDQCNESLRLHNVDLPLAHQGIRNALRAAYAHQACEIPEEFRRLLAGLR